MTWRKRRAIVVGVVILFVVLILGTASKPQRLASNSVLVIDAEGTIEEQPPVSFLGSLTGSSVPVLHDYLDAIDSARTDSRISGVVVRIAPLSTGWGKLEEIRAHLLTFRTSHKPSICYLGYDGVGNPEYYLASACEQVWLVPSNSVSIQGMMAEALFFRGTLDKLKIIPEFYHVAEFKTAYNMFTEKKFTPPHREEVESVLRSIYAQYVTGAAAARGIDRVKFESFLNAGPLSTSDAVEDKIVDRLGYWDQVQDYFKSRYRGWNPISVNRYRTFLSNDGIGGDKIAVVHATGLIVSGESQATPGGGFVMGGDSVASDIRDARNDASIRAIVLRIDSGGGSVVGSEVIRREVELAQGQKPVVVSMSDVAASGGYWIATPAAKIIADANTITGSIGVLTGKLNLSGLYNLLGVTSDYVATSDNATLFSDQQSFTAVQEASIKKSLDDTYMQFTEGVAKGRHMSVEAVDKIAKGREWSGAQGKELGLVDEIGGFDRAIEVAKELAHIPASENVHIVRFPEEKSIFEELLEREQDHVTQSRSLEETVRRLVGMMDPVQARIPYELHIR
ncbi:MAG: signal peptide peptidase SppA [Candidatus Acidiferrales bacterium]|jgi:protease-4